MRKDLATIHQIDRNALVFRIPEGPEKGKHYVQTDLMIPPHSAGEAPAADTVVGAIAALWAWIEAVPEGKWITLPGRPERRSHAYRWTESGWKAWSRS